MKSAPLIAAMRWPWAYRTAFALVVCAALWLRVDDLSRRPMHADEANQAVKFGALLERGEYRFDPIDHHGPTLYYLTLPVAWLRQQSTLASLDERTIRLVPALAGTLAVILLIGLAAPLGHWPALAAGAFLATAPPAVYYSRYYVQETLLLTFTLGALVAAIQWWRQPRAGWAVLAGCAIGLMLATKASAPLFLTAAVSAGAVVGWGQFMTKPWRRGLAVALGTAVVTAAVFYSSFGTWPRGLLDSVRAYSLLDQRLTGASGHEKPAGYYLELFLLQRRGGLAWHQLGLLLVALGGTALAWRRTQPLLRAAVIYSAVLWMVMAMIPYKTPWQVIHLLPALAVLAAGLLSLVPVIVGALGFVLVAVTQLQQVQRVVFAYPADARNPFAYVHSAPDVLKVAAMAERAMASHPGGVIRVMGPEWWPLPWYLRKEPRVGYWAEPPVECEAALLLVAAEQAEVVKSRLRESYRESFVGLRPGRVLVVFEQEAEPR